MVGNHFSFVDIPAFVRAAPYPVEFIGEKYHKDQAGYKASFNKAARLFNEVFTLANEVGVVTATGIEIPVGRDGETGEEPLVNGIPEVLQRRLINKYNIDFNINYYQRSYSDPLSPEAAVELYRGMYKWLLYNNIPVDYFWMWTTEIWMPWGGASLDSLRVELARQNIEIAVSVYENMDEKPFKQFATGGWITGAQGDPDVFGDVLPDLDAAYAAMNPPYNEIGRRMKTDEWIDLIQGCLECL